MTWNRILAVVGLICGVVALALGLFTHELRTAVDFAGGGLIALGAALVV